MCLYIPPNYNSQAEHPIKNAEILAPKSPEGDFKKPLFRLFVAATAKRGRGQGAKNSIWTTLKVSLNSLFIV
jgi:hypothetical protein